MVLLERRDIFIGAIVTRHYGENTPNSEIARRGVTREDKG